MMVLPRKYLKWYSRLPLSLACPLWDYPAPDSVVLLRTDLGLSATPKTIESWVIYIDRLCDGDVVTLLASKQNSAKTLTSHKLCIKNLLIRRSQSTSKMSFKL